jgi:Mce-associated membrane protein
MTDEGPASIDEGAETVAKVTAETEDGAKTIAETAEVLVVDDAGETLVVTGEEPVVGDETADKAAAVKEVGVRWPLVGAVAGAFGGLLVGAGILGWQVWQQHQINDASNEAKRAAISYAQVLTSIDSNKVDENFKDVLDGATGEFKDMYSQSSVELRQLLIENKATAHGVVVDAAVQEASKNKAVVLLFVDQSVTNTKLPDPRIDRSRMKMTLEKVDGRWRASKVELP